MLLLGVSVDRPMFLLVGLPLVVHVAVGSVAVGHVCAAARSNFISMT